MIGNMIFDRLTTYGATAAILSNRVYPQLLPQEPTLPGATYDINMGVPGEGTAPLRSATIRVTGWGEVHADVQALGDELVNALNDWSDRSAGAAQLLWCTFVSSADVYDPELNIWGLTVTFEAIVANY